MSTAWRGRIDPPGVGDTRRWHQLVAPPRPDGPPGIALLGFASDEGIRRNGGRPGAALGPSALRAAMANLPVLQEQPFLYDTGDVCCTNGNLEDAQAEFASRTRALLDLGHSVIGLGGGHEIAYASYRGLADHVAESNSRIGIVNFDAHLDIRDHAMGNSGTPFLQAIRHAEMAGHALRYLCIGASRAANTPGLFALASRMNVDVVMDDEIDADGLPVCIHRLVAWLDNVDTVYLTVCLDVLSQSIAPAVSAPNPGGIALRTLERLIEIVGGTGKARVLDIAELSPPYDQDGSTARLGARLAHRMAQGLSPHFDELDTPQSALSGLCLPPVHTPPSR